MINLTIFNARHLVIAMEKQRAECIRHADAGNLWLAEGCYNEALRIEAELRTRTAAQDVTPRPLRIA